MKDSGKQTIIATFCKWSNFAFIRTLEGRVLCGRNDEICIEDDYNYPLDEDGEMWGTVIPDYINKKDEICKALSLLDDDQWLDFMLNLCNVLNKHQDLGKWTIARAFLEATSIHLSDALIKTIN